LVPICTCCQPKSCSCQLGVVVTAAKTKRGGKFQYVFKKKGLLKKPVYNMVRSRLIGKNRAERRFLEALIG